jgi:hypothetical protein
MRLPTKATNLLAEASGYLSCCTWTKLNSDFFRNSSAFEAVRLKGLWFGGEPLLSTQGSKAEVCGESLRLKICGVATMSEFVDPALATDP